MYRDPVNAYTTSQELAKVLGPDKGRPTGTYTLKKRLAVFGHDVLAHPLIWLTNDAKWAWAFHDYCGDIVTMGSGAGANIRITGPGSAEAIRVLKDAGFDGFTFWPADGEVKSPYQNSGGGGGRDTSNDVFVRFMLNARAKACGRGTRNKTEPADAADKLRAASASAALQREELGQEVNKKRVEVNKRQLEADAARSDLHIMVERLKELEAGKG